MCSYNALGDRHQQNPSTGSGTGVNYTLDLNTGLSQVLSDGTNTYLYGNGRISQHDTGAPDTSYFLGDALGSVRQLADSAGAVTLTQSYAPYGETVFSVGSGYSAYQYTGESRDANGLTYLRARYYNSGDGRFLSRDTWGGEYERPLSLNRWGYVEGNPVNLADPSGHSPEVKSQILSRTLSRYSSTSFSIEAVFTCSPDTRKLDGQYDLTGYLALAMTKHGQDPRVKRIANLISWAKIVPNNAIGTGLWFAAYTEFYNLEASEKEWDIKVKIKEELGANIILCGTGNNCHWLDFSTPGNIHFGYIAELANIDEFIAAIAGGVLEQKDLLTKNLTLEPLYCFQNRFPGFCDNPADQAAVDFGYSLAKNPLYASGISDEALRRELQANGLRNFQTNMGSSDRLLFPIPYAQTNYYGADYFDN